MRFGGSRSTWVLGLCRCFFTVPVSPFATPVGLELELQAAWSFIRPPPSDNDVGPKNKAVIQTQQS